MGNILTIQKVFNILESSITKSIMSLQKSLWSPKASSSTFLDTIRHTLPWWSQHIWPIRSWPYRSTLSSGIHQGMSCILLTHQIVTMPIDSVIRDPSRILLTHRIVTMPINSVIMDLSCILLTHRIVTMPIDFVIRDLSRILLIHRFGRPTARTSPPLMIDYFRLHVEFACSPLICLYIEITCIPRPKTLLRNQTFHIWEEKP